MRTYLSIAVAFAVGVGLGYFLFGRTGGGPPGPGSGSRTAAGRRAGTGAAARLGRGPAPRPDRSGAPGADPLVRSVRQRNVQLAEENRRLAARLDELEQDLRFARGLPMPWPADAPGRLRRKAVVSAVNEALRQAGLRGEVTDVDCKEYPCVLAGTLKGQIAPDRFKKILGTAALKAYRDDHAQTSITVRSGHDSLGRPWLRSHFALSLMVSGPAGTDPEVKRTVYRLRQLLDAATGQ